MDLGTKILLILVFLVFDLITVFIPLTPIAVVVILISKPQWFKEFVDELYLKK